MKKMSLVLVLSCINAGTLGASEWAPATAAEVLAGLQRQEQMVQDTEEALRAFGLKNKAERSENDPRRCEPVFRIFGSVVRRAGGEGFDTKVAALHGSASSPLKKSMSVSFDALPSTPPFDCCAPSSDSLTKSFVFSVKSASLPSTFGGQPTITALSIPLPLPPHLEARVGVANVRTPSSCSSDEDCNEATVQNEKEKEDSDDDLLQA